MDSLNFLERKFPIKDEILLKKAKCYKKLKNLDESQQYYEKAYELFPKSFLVNLRYKIN